MRFEPTPLAGAYVIDLEPIEDNRGFFARSYCENEFEKHGLPPVGVQCNTSYSKLKGTVRGMHTSVPPGAEAKLVRCIRGGVWDVIVDLRSNSPTRLKSFAVELTADNRMALFIPVGFAHGFQTLSDETEVFYHMSARYLPDAQRGYRYNDPALGIDWPLPVSTVSDKDAVAPLMGDGGP